MKSWFWGDSAGMLKPKASQKGDGKQKSSWPDGPSRRALGQHGVSGGGHAATEDGVDVPEVVLQRGHLLGVLLRGEDLRGKLSQLRRRREESLSAEKHLLKCFFFFFLSADVLATTRCKWGLDIKSIRLLESREGWWGCRGNGNTDSCCAWAGAPSEEKVWL